MLRTIEMYTNEYKDTTKKEIRKKKGQFFTPAEVSMRMAAVENKYPKNQLIRVLDPGAGNGILSFAVIDKLLRSGYKRLDITLIETDKEILPVLEYTITKIRQICESYHAECTIHYIDQNFVLWESSCLYDIVICNPPYMKVRKDSIEATAMKAYVYGQPNLYGLFMAKAVELLRDNGQYVFITPRSWTSGKYFTKVRSFLQKELNIKEIDLFSSRDEVFQGEKVLQETMILYGEKGQIQNEKTFREVLPPSFFASCDCSNLSAFWKVCVVLSLISFLRSCNISDMQARCHYCHDIIRAWKSPDLKNCASPFLVSDLHTQKGYLHSIFRLVSG